MAVFRLQVSSKAPILEELLVSFTNLHTPMHPGIVSSGPRDYRHKDSACLMQPISGQAGRSFPLGMKSVVVDTSKYDWEGDDPLQRPFATTVIYEKHVAGFTRHPSSGIAAELRGTYAGMIEAQASVGSNFGNQARSCSETQLPAGCVAL
jgi:hypothetical protein